MAMRDKTIPELFQELEVARRRYKAALDRADEQMQLQIICSLCRELTKRGV